jgi:hypothetical protein
MFVACSLPTTALENWKYVEKVRGGDTQSFLVCLLPETLNSIEFSNLVRPFVAQSHLARYSMAPTLTFELDYESQTPIQRRLGA